MSSAPEEWAVFVVFIETNSAGAYPWQLGSGIPVLHWGAAEVTTSGSSFSVGVRNTQSGPKKRDEVLHDTDNLPVTIRDIRAAADAIKGAVERTPARYSQTLSQIAGLRHRPEIRELPVHRFIQGSRRTQQAHRR